MLIDRLKAYAPGAIPMHMPGHKRNARLAEYLSGLPTDIDITEIDGFDDLHAPCGILKESMRLASKLWGSDESIYLVNGSTCGLLASVYALGFGGGEAVVARNCHKSAYHALEVTGVKPNFMLPEYDRALGAFGKLTTESVEKALDQTPDARFVLLTSPTYEGVMSDILGIVRVSHRRNVPVIVDEAHGAHLGLFGVFPSGAVRAGADIVIQSLHKTLPSLTQTAILHRNGNLVDGSALYHALDVFETSSPSYPLLSSMDGCVHLLTDAGRPILEMWFQNLERFYEGALRLTSLRVRRRPDADPGKIVIETGGAGISGFELMRVLREEYSIELEMAMPAYALAMTGAGDTRENLDALFTALLEIDEGFASSKSPSVVRDIGASVSKKSAVSSAEAEKCGADAARDVFPKCGTGFPEAPTLPEAVLSPREALRANSVRVPVSDSEGRVSADYAWAYPPGIPMVVPGERIPRGFAGRWARLRASGAKTVLTGGGGDLIRVVG